MMSSWIKRIVIAALVIPIAVQAQPRGPGQGPGHRGGHHGFGPPAPPGGEGRMGSSPSRRHGPMGRAGFGQDIWNHPEMKERLNLSEEQVERLQESRLELETHQIDVQAKTEIARLNLENLLKKKEIEEETVEELINELGDLHKERIRGMVHQKLALREILKESQLEKVEAFLNRSRARHGLDSFAPGRGDRPGRMREEMQKRRQDRMRGGPKKGDKETQKGPGKKGGEGDPDKVGFAPPPWPDFPPSDFKATGIGTLPPVEDGLIDLGVALSEALEMEK